MKNIGFLSFGHWSPSPQSGTRSAADVLLQSIDLAVAAEELGADGAYFRVHHFARQLSSHTNRIVCVPKPGTEIQDRTIYISPGNAHLTCVVAGRRRKIEHLQHYSGSRYSPSVDALFESVAEVYGPDALAIVLSGMGNDGTAGAACLSRNGGKVIVQDAETCVVWGMPGAVAKAGLADAILSPGSMTRLLGQAVKL